MAEKEIITSFESATEKIADSKIMKDIGSIFVLFFPAVKKVLVVFIAFLCLFTFFSGTIFDFVKFLIPKNAELIAFSPGEVFSSIITLIVSFSIAFTLPFLLFELSRIILPALYENEKKAFKKILPASFILLVLGTIFGILVMAFFGLSFFADFSESYGVKNVWGLSGVINSFITMGVGFGLAFQFPLLMIFLVKFGLIKVNTLSSIRGYVVVLLLIISAVLTPPDVMSQLIMFFPLYFLYEGTLLYLKAISK